MTGHLKTTRTQPCSSVSSADPAPEEPEVRTREIARDVILIGASAGGIQAVGKLLSGLPHGFKARIGVTLHRSPAFKSMLSSVLGIRSPLEVVEPKGGETFQPGRVFLAPPDHHLVFDGGLVLLDHGPKERHARPSVDVMFRSGARSFGPRVVGVILTGNLDDGVSGLISIKRHGGISLAQEPAEAYAPSMPLNALARDDVDIILRLDALGAVLEKLAGAKGVAGALRIPGTRRPNGEPSLLDA
jgi:two-component system chemotaxis response regulator CheB